MIAFILWYKFMLVVTVKKFILAELLIFDAEMWADILDLIDFYCDFRICSDRKFCVCIFRWPHKTMGVV
jgi:hypothetical protein